MTLPRPSATPPARRRVAGRLGVGSKFFGAVSVLLVAVLAVAAFAALALSHTKQQADTLFRDHLASADSIGEVRNTLYEVETAALVRAQLVEPDDQVRQDAQLDSVILPAADRALRNLRTLDSDSPFELGELQQVQDGLQHYRGLRTTGQPVPAMRAGVPAAQLVAIFDPMNTVVAGLGARESQLAADTTLAIARGYRADQLRLLAAVAASMLLALVVALLLIRDLLPRIRQYASFATDVAHGGRPVPLTLRGADELSQLGGALNAMVEQAAWRADQDVRQTEFVDTLQVTSTELEAHELLQRHLDRSLAGGSTLVLQRNNSANRLQAATPPPAGSGLAARLVGAEPRSCLAVRFGRTHQQGLDLAPLLVCELCPEQECASTCEPLLVGGEVIGSVLITHPDPLDPAEAVRIKTSVGQAAPVLANLRNLALAEFRANSDSLTGLPNKRSTDDTLKRMVAQASRSVTPLAAIMLDLDHFKQINDRYGHDRGDEVLAAVGSALLASVRASDFAGRFGGEEFLILLPDTGLTDATQVAEKVRATVASISVPGVDREITASLGVAALLEHAGNALGLLPASDQALYAVKAAGRNRTVVAGCAPKGSDAVVPAAT